MHSGWKQGLARNSRRQASSGACASTWQRALDRRGLKVSWLIGLRRDGSQYQVGRRSGDALRAHPPNRRSVPAHIRQRVEQILSDQGVHAAGDGQATEGKSGLEVDGGGHGDMQILHGNGASYSGKVERLGGEVAVTITHVMALPMRAAGMLYG